MSTVTEEFRYLAKELSSLYQQRKNIAKDILFKSDCVGSNPPLSQLLNSTIYFPIAGAIFFVIGIRGLVVLLKP